MAPILKGEPERMGDYLLRRGLISALQLDAALLEHETTQQPLGRILLHQGAMAPQPMQQAMAERDEVPYLDLITHPIDASLLSAAYSNDYVTRGYLPIALEGGTLLIAAIAITHALKEDLEKEYGQSVVLMLTSPYDILWTVKRVLGATLDEAAREQLFRERPMRSARYRVTSRMTKPIAFATILASLLLWADTALVTVVVALNVFYIATLGLKIVLFIASLFYKAPESAAHLAETYSDKELPIYTLLIPMYQEAATVPQIIGALRAMEYPRSKLDIKLIVEADDDETIAAIKHAKPEAMFEMIRVPYSLPRTKPKACNFAMHFARGEYVVVYDAEDIPDVAQLKKSVGMFRAMSFNTTHPLACVQARLNYYNRSENILTKLFSLEYAALFEFMHRGLSVLGIPILLGGTSNHLSRDALIQAGSWDPYNVTEDADLGIRLAVEGYQTLPLNSDTMEEAPVTLGVWMVQRSRWIKGYLQTWMVYLRTPSELIQHYGFWKFWGLQTFLGGASLVYLASPFLWGLSIAYIMGLELPVSLPHWLITSCFIVLLVGVTIQWVMAAVIVRTMRWKYMLDAVLAYPFYWFLHIGACVIAIWELVVSPYRWRKTPHNRSNQLPVTSGQQVKNKSFCLTHGG